MKKKSIFSFLLIIILALIMLFTFTPPHAEKPLEDRELYLTYINDVIGKTITESMSDYEKAKAIHDYIIIHSNYDTSEPLQDAAFTPEGIFVYGNAVCQGYAEAYKLILNELEIDCELVTGSAGGIVHAWNVVKIDNEWYHVDVTWDDPIINGQSVTGTDNLSYAYFMKPDDLFYKDHIAASNPPECTSEKYVYIEQYYNVPYAVLESANQIPDSFASHYASGGRSLTLYFPETTDPANNGILTTLIRTLNQKSSTEIGLSYYPVARFHNYSVITIFAE